MRVKSLSHLVEIWKLVEKDPATKSVFLDKKGAHLTGMHVGASRRAKLPLEAGLDVDGVMLTGALDLFPLDAQLSLKRTESSLILRAGERRAMLRVYVAPPPKDRLRFRNAREFDSTKLRAALPFLRACTSGGVVTPVLTGIHFAAGKRVTLEATDAERRTGRLTLALPCKAAGQVVPAADLEQALSLLEKKIAMKFSRGHLHLQDRTTAIKLSLLQGKYPDLSRHPQPAAYKYKITLDRARLDTIIRAAILLDSDRLVTFVVKDKQASWIVRSQETGGFREPIGACKLPDIAIIFDAHWLDAAQYVGNKITLRYNDGRSPVLFTGNKRLLWMSPVVG